MLTSEERQEEEDKEQPIEEDHKGTESDYDSDDSIPILRAE